MNNQPPNQSSNNQQSGSNQPNASTSRADQPTPVSGNSQSQGTQSPSGSQSNQGNQSGQSVGNDLKQTGRELANEAKNAVSNATSEVKSQVSDLTQSAQTQASNFLGEQKGMAAERIGGVADALRSAGQELAGRDESMLAQYTDSLAGQLDRFSNTLRDREIGSLIDDAKQLAHRQPELFVAGALAAGFVLGRFFKSSRNSGNYQNAYSEFDPRDPSRIYGEQYGQGYGDQFNRSRGPESSRDYDAGFRGGYQQEYGSPYNQGSYNQSNWQQAGQPAGQVTTHGVGTGQSLDRQADLRKGQEFGQGEEQVSNYKGNDTKKASQSTQQPDKREGEVR